MGRNNAARTARNLAEHWLGCISLYSFDGAIVQCFLRSRTVGNWIYSPSNRLPEPPTAHVAFPCYNRNEGFGRRLSPIYRSSPRPLCSLKTNSREKPNSNWLRFAAWL